METKKQLRKKYSDLRFDYNLMEREIAELRRLLQSAREAQERLISKLWEKNSGTASPSRKSTMP